MTHPLVSIIIPVFNQERFIRHAIKSALDQDYPCKEVLVIDDGSTDSTPAVLRSFGKQIRIFQTDNFGAGSARNLGVRSSSGAYLAFLDSDDTWENSKIRLQVEALNEAMEIDFAVTLFQNMSAFDHRAQIEAERGRGVFGQTRPGFLPSALLVRRKSFDRVGYFNETIAAPTEDFEWFIRANELRLRHTIINEPLVFRRLHFGNTTRWRLAESRTSLLDILHQSLLRKRKVESRPPEQ